MERWNRAVKEDHELLISQGKSLESALAGETSAEDKRLFISWIVGILHPMLELHLRKEDEVLLPALRILLGEEACAVTVLKEERDGLRGRLRWLAELLQAPEQLDWEAVTIASDSLLELLEDHENETNRLLMDLLQEHLTPKELKALGEAFQEVARKAYEEEGWPK